MLKNISEAGATAEGSANTLISTMKAFKLEAGDVSHVVDSLNEVSNRICGFYKRPVDSP